MQSQAHLMTAAELKRRGITRYDAEIIIEQGLSLPGPKSNEEYAQVWAAERADSQAHVSSDIRLDLCSSFDSLCSAADQDCSAYKAQPRAQRTICSKNPPCSQRQQRPSKKKKHKPIRACGVEKADAEDMISDGVDGNHICGSPRARSKTPFAKENARSNPTIVGLLQAGCKNLRDSEANISPGHRMNGKFPRSGGKSEVGRRTPVRHSPRLRQLQSPFSGPGMCGDVSSSDSSTKPCVSLLGDFNRISTTAIKQEVLSGEEEGEGDLLNKSLDSNHNFHDPPVLEPEIPFLTPATCNTHGNINGLRCKMEGEEADSLLSDVPQLSFCGDLSLTHKSNFTSSLQDDFSSVHERGRKRKKPDSCVQDKSMPPGKLPRMVFRMRRDPILEEKLSQCSSSAITFKWKQPKKLRLRFGGNSVERLLPQDTNYPS